MNQWITDRLPTEEDAPNGVVLWKGKRVYAVPIFYVGVGEPWMRLPAPYVKPKSHKVPPPPPPPFKDLTIMLREGELP